MSEPIATIKLGLLTGALLALLRSVEVAGQPALVGDMVIPEDDRTGWSGGGPNDPGGVFTPYGILVPLDATPVPSGSFANPMRDWQTPYMVQSYGVNRDQTQWLGDRFREALQEMVHTELELEDAVYTVAQVQIARIGAPQRVPGTDPAYYGQQEQSTLWLMRKG